MQHNVDLSKFDGSGFDKGAGFVKIALWYFVNAIVVRSSWNPFMGIKVALLKLFGAKIGSGLVIKNDVNIKYPWKLIIGNNCWIGEKVWIDNIDSVIIGNNVCVSQGALLLTGNHDYKDSAMPYRNSPIIIKDGAWIGAETIVCAGVTIHEDAILTVGSMTSKDLESNGVYQGIPARRIRTREITR